MRIRAFEIVGPSVLLAGLLALSAPAPMTAMADPASNANLENDGAREGLVFDLDLFYGGLLSDLDVKLVAPTLRYRGGMHSLGIT